MVLLLSRKWRKWWSAAVQSVRHKKKTIPLADFHLHQYFLCSCQPAYLILVLKCLLFQFSMEKKKLHTQQSSFLMDPVFCRKTYGGKRKKCLEICFSWHCWTDDVQKQTYFYYEVDKKTKKNKNKLTFSSHLLPFVGYDESNAVPHCLFPGGLTGHWCWWLDHFHFTSCKPFCEFCALGVTLTGSFTDSPQGGAVLWHERW